ncbi:uncharacterized protein C2845_PM02G43900 [Panicum miliaceum]|uniref:Uncharacterized protein n=1 Tax=Panicum miliaceum TaxID=4540 RepID=A0A3L6S6T9_PANMI|nr:uncharacterized protein C2845_PM02G43900 [Panicum miliaceum]
MDLGMTARDGSEQADNVLRAINHEPAEELGQIEGFDWDDAMLKEEIGSFYKRYHALPANDDYEAWAPISDQQLQDMELRFAICRIKAHKMLKGEDLSVAELRNMYPPPMLEEEEYFRRVERHFEWYFDPKYCEFAHMEDYQRLALRNTEYLCSVRFDNTWYEDFASLYFDIWKLVAKQKYYTYVAEINENLTEGEAYKLVMEAVKKFVPKNKSYYDYAKKNLDIAEKNRFGTPDKTPQELNVAEQFRGHCITRVGRKAIPRNRRPIDVDTPTEGCPGVRVFGPQPATTSTGSCQPSLNGFSGRRVSVASDWQNRGMIDSKAKAELTLPGPMSTYLKPYPFQ